MANRKHRISKEKALSLTAAMQARIAAAGSPFKDFPEGFSFDIEAVRQLVSNPNAAHFVIRFGWDDTPPGKGIVPVLSIADSNFAIIETGMSSQPDATSATSSFLRDEGLTGTEEIPGDYLDEGSRYPPKP